MESSVYSLASPSSSSPYLYAGVENAVLELAFTSILDKHPDPTYFAPWRPQKGGKEDNWRSKEVLDLAMYDQTPDMKLCIQKSMSHQTHPRVSRAGRVGRAVEDWFVKPKHRFLSCGNEETACGGQMKKEHASLHIPTRLLLSPPIGSATATRLPFEVWKIAKSWALQL